MADEEIIFQAILRGLEEHQIKDRAVAASIAKQLDDIGMFGESSQAKVIREEQLSLIL